MNRHKTNYTFQLHLSTLSCRLFAHSGRDLSKVIASSWCETRAREDMIKVVLTEATDASRLSTVLLRPKVHVTGNKGS